MVIKSSDDAKDTSSPNMSSQAAQAQAPEYGNGTASPIGHNNHPHSYFEGFQMPPFGRGRGGFGFRGMGRHGWDHRPEVVSLEGDQDPNSSSSRHHQHGPFWAHPSVPDPPLAPIPPVAPRAPSPPSPFGFGRPGQPPHPFDIPAGIASFIGDIFGPPAPSSSEHQHHRGPMGHPGGPGGHPGGLGGHRGGPMGWRMRGMRGGRGGWGGPWGHPHEHGHHHHPHPSPPPAPPAPGQFPGLPHHHHERGPIRPKMNIQHTGNVFTVTVELPGLQKEQVDISVADGILTISGEFVDNAPAGVSSFPPGYEAEGFDMMDESEETLYGGDGLEEGVEAMNLNETPSGDCGFVLRERRFGPFKRAVKLPAWVDVEAIKATMAHGVLSLVVEKPEEGEKVVPAKKINVL